MDATWNARVTLKDGQPMLLRALTPADAPRWQAFVDSVSGESWYRRMGNPRRRFTAAEVGHYVTLDYRMRVAIAAVDGVGTEERIVGIARYDRIPDTKQAEVAVLVHDAYQQRGLGTAMLTTLADIARENGIETLEADVLPYNQRMLEVLLHLGYRLEAGSAKRTGLVRLLKPLTAATES